METSEEEVGTAGADLGLPVEVGMKLVPTSKTPQMQAQSLGFGSADASGSAAARQDGSAAEPCGCR